MATCTERWPEARSGEYNPACCRFPKSCSAEPEGDVIERAARVLSERWRDMHTGESLGMQRHLARALHAAGLLREDN